MCIRDRAEVDSAHAHELARDVPADEAQVAGDDGVVVGGRAARVPEMRRKRVAGRGGHGGAHVVRIGYPGVHDAPGGDVYKRQTLRRFLIVSATGMGSFSTMTLPPLF